MKRTTEDLIRYRLVRAWDTFEDAKILAEKERWNSAINRLYYAAYYAVMALLLSEGNTEHRTRNDEYRSVKAQQLHHSIFLVHDSIFPVLHSRFNILN